MPINRARKTTVTFSTTYILQNTQKILLEDGRKEQRKDRDVPRGFYKYISHLL